MSRTSTAQQDQERAILAAATAEFAAVGVRSASVETIARHAQVSRSTVYRRFPSKEDLLAAVGDQLRADFLRDLVATLDGLDPRAAVVEAFAATTAALRESPLARRLLADEPETADLLVGLTTTDQAMIRGFSQAIATTLRRAGANMPDDQLHQAAELQFRLTASFVLTGSATLDLDDDAAIRRFAHTFLAPMIW